MTYVNGNPGFGFWQAQKCDRVKSVNGIPKCWPTNFCVSDSSFVWNADTNTRERTNRWPAMWHVKLTEGSYIFFMKGSLTFFFCRNVESACCFVRIKTKLQNVLNFFKCEKRRKHMYNFVVYYVFVTHKGQAKNSCRKKKLIDYHMYTTCNQTRNLYIYKLAWLASDEFSCENSFIVLGLGLWYVIIYIFGSKS